MALAILDLVDVAPQRARFRLETGTNPYWQLVLGSGVSRRGGVGWIDGVLGGTSLSNGAGAPAGSLFSGARTIAVKTPESNGEPLYAQLFSFKTPGRMSPAYSEVVEVPATGAIRLDKFRGSRLLHPESVTAMETTTPVQRTRTIPCRTYQEAYARPASIEDLLGAIAKVAVPLLGGLVGSGGGGKDGQAGTAAPVSRDLGKILSDLLGAILGGGGGANVQATMKSLSIPQERNGGNRFVSAARHWSQPMIFGIDDALIGSLLGPFIQILPQLANAANQKRIELKKADNKLVTDALSEVNRRMLLERLLAAQTPASNNPDLSALIAAIQGGSVPADSGSSPGASSSASASPVMSKSKSVPSRAATLSFEVADGLPWNGKTFPVFVRDREVRFPVRLAIVGTAPKNPLTRAILTLVFKDSVGNEVLRSETRLQGVPANAVVEGVLTPEDVARLPANRPLTALAEMRWPGSAPGTTVKASGARELLFVNKYFAGDQGGSVSPERELFDMQRYRSYWVKIWEAPTLAETQDKSLWKLDAAVKYSVLLTPDHATHGVMAPKLRADPDDSGSLTLQTSGKMKAGIELSVPELAKLTTLWGEPTLDAEHLEALQTIAFARRNAGEAVFRAKLAGRRGERGMCWVVPIFQLVEVSIFSPTDVNRTGQVTSTNEEKVRFPVPVAVRVLGIKSVPEQPPGGTGDEAPTDAYAFDGYSIEVQDRFALTPPATRERAPA